MSKVDGHKFGPWHPVGHQPGSLAAVLFPSSKQPMLSAILAMAVNQSLSLVMESSCLSLKSLLLISKLSLEVFRDIIGSITIYALAECWTVVSYIVLLLRLVIRGCIHRSFTFSIVNLVERVAVSRWAWHLPPSPTHP